MEQNLKMKDIPFKELEMIGISKEQFLDLPKQVLDQLMSGRMSPLLKLKFEAGGKKITLPAKLAFERGKDGQVHAITYPVRKELKNDIGLSEEQVEQLKNNETIVHTVERDGKKEKMLVQMDGETRRLITARQNELKIPESIGGIQLGQQQTDAIREGRPVQLEVGDTKVTVGVDLNTRGGFKVVEGDMNEWLDKKLIRWDKANPGVAGYWRTSENAWEYEQHVRREDRTQGHVAGVHEEQQQSRGMRMRR